MNLLAPPLRSAFAVTVATLASPLHAAPGQAPAVLLSQNFSSDPVNYTLPGKSSPLRHAAGPRYWAISNTPGLAVNPGITGNDGAYLATQNINDGDFAFSEDSPAQIDFTIPAANFSNLKLSIALAAMPTAEANNFIRALTDANGDGTYETTLFHFKGGNNSAYADPVHGALTSSFRTLSNIPLPEPTAADGKLRLRLESFNDTESQNEATGIDTILISGTPASKVTAGEHTKQAIAASPTSPPNGKTDIGKSTTLTVNVTNPDKTPLTVTFYGRKTTPAKPGPDFTLVTLPDTQHYSENADGKRGDTFHAQTRWIVDQRKALNIAFVSHMGDIVQNGDFGGYPAEWEIADTAMRRIENPQTTLLSHGIPWGAAPGNHDQSPAGDAAGATKFFNQYFGVRRFEDRSYYGGHYGTDNDNNYQLFSASGLDFIILHLEYDTRASAESRAVLDWADTVLKAHPDRRAIITTHWLVNTGNPASFSAQGQAIHDRLKNNPNLFLMLGGHIAGEGRRSDVFEGRTVHSVLQDYQNRPNGGDGWLRYFVFSPANNSITAKTYQVANPLNPSSAEESDSDSRFTLAYDMQSAVTGWIPIGTAEVRPGENSACIEWTGLEPGAHYEWHATTGGNTAVGKTHRFSTGASEPASSSNASPSDHPDTRSELLTRGPYLQMAAPTQITIRWRSKNSMAGRVRYGTDPAKLDKSADESTAPPAPHDHSVTLNGLKPATTYHYSVGSATDVLADGPLCTFTTPPPHGTATPTRIWVLGDAGTADSAQASVRNAFYTWTKHRVPNLVLQLGDNAYSKGTDEEFTAAMFNVYPTMLSRTPFWSCLGNHETYAGAPFPYFNIHTFPTAGECGGSPSGTEHYYSFNYGNIHFISLDSMISNRAVDNPATPRANEDGPMAAWLRTDLASTTATWIICFFHHPPYTKGSHDSDTEGEHIQMRANFLPILEAGGVDLVLGGHSHSYERSFLLDGHYGISSSFTPSMRKNPGNGRPDGNGAYTKPLTGQRSHQGAVYAVAGSAGKISGGPLNHPAHFISLNQLGSLVLDIQGPRLDATFVRENGSTPDTFTIIKKSTPGAPTSR